MSSAHDVSPLRHPACNRSRHPETDWYTMDLDVYTSDARKYGLLAGIILNIVLLIFSKWFKKYRLRYLLRSSCLIYIYLTFLNVLCQDSEYTYTCPTTAHERLLLREMALYVIAVMIVVRYHWGVPFDIVKDCASVGFSHLSRTAKFRRHSLRHLAANRLRSGEPGDVPPVFPNGWIPLIASAEIKRKGQVASVSALGRRFCVFRGEEEEGRVHVLDAFCPHLGADLSAGGVVSGSCIECPFHGWRFSGESGRCTSVPYCKDKVPEVARVPVWPSREVNAFVFVWHHAEGEEPSWEMPAVLPHHWRYRGRTQHEVRCHIQEIPENGADAAHLHQLHSRSVLLGGRGWMRPPSPLDAVQHRWEPEWAPDEERPHVARVRLTHRTRLFGLFDVPFARLDMDIEQIGPATVHLHVSSWFGRGVLLQHVTPEAPLRQRVVHLFYAEPGFRQLPADLLVLAEAVMLERDIAVWNNKKFLRKPVLVREDRQVARYRRWYSQFYSEHSPTWRQSEKSLEW